MRMSLVALQPAGTSTVSANGSPAAAKPTSGGTDEVVSGTRELHELADALLGSIGRFRT